MGMSVSDVEYLYGMSDKRGKSIADVLRESFAASGLNMKRLADTSGTGYSGVHGFFRTRTRDPQLSVVQRWADVLGLELRPRRRRGEGGTK